MRDKYTPTTPAPPDHPWGAKRTPPPAKATAKGARASQPEPTKPLRFVRGVGRLGTALGGMLAEVPADKRCWGKDVRGSK